MKTISFVVISMCLLIFAGCAENHPLLVDGSSTMDITAVWDSSGTIKALSYANLIISSEYGVHIYLTDAEGKCLIEHLPASKYGVSVRKNYPLDSNIIIVGNKREIDLTKNGSFIKDTIKAVASSASGIVINEIYAGGPVNNQYYFYDQYIELYNASDSVKYLDGMMISRVSGGSSDYGKGPGSDYGNDGDIDTVTYIFKFPGYFGGTQYPFAPKTFKVIASTAVNHQKTVSTSIDLSNADWEFYNQYSATDIDNPNVPNLLNMRPEKTVDFLINLVSDVIVLSDGKDSVFQDGIDITSIIDGVEYQSSPTSLKSLDDRVDRGFVLSPPKYSGKSMQRRNAGVDTNDGNLDWMIIDHPTPGRQ